VEHITNADDSYHRLCTAQKIPNDGGKILIECQEKRNGRGSVVIVRDRAEGMTFEDMDRKLRRVGDKTSVAGDRGFMGAGAKDCTAIGDIKFESIKDDRYFWYEIMHIDGEINHGPRKGERANDVTRRRLGIKHGNGTTVTLALLSEQSLPRIQTLRERLACHVQLRDIVADRSDTQLFITKSSDRNPIRIRLAQPEGDLKVDETFQIHGWDGASASLRIWKSPSRLESDGPDFDRHGITIKGQRAIHEHSMLEDRLKRDENATFYFGRLECTYIDRLMEEFSQRHLTREPRDPRNSKILVDPNRRSGLDRYHPFTNELLKIPIHRLDGLLQEEKRRQRAADRSIANEDTIKRFEQYGRIADKCLQEHLEDAEDYGDGDVGKNVFSKTNVVIAPQFSSLVVGERKALNVYVSKEVLIADGAVVSFSSLNPDAVSVDTPACALMDHPQREDAVYATATVVGAKPTHRADIKATVVIGGRESDVVARLRVTEDDLPEHEFAEPFEFQYESYRIREQRSRPIRLYARVPDVLTAPMEVRVIPEDHTCVGVLGRCVLRPVRGREYAVGEIRVEGRRLKSVSAIRAILGDRRAQTTVQVVEKWDGDGVQIKVTPVEVEGFGGVFRAIWDRDNTNELKVAIKHPSIRRYLGPPPDYAGQSHPVYRVLIAEIVAESVGRRIVQERETMGLDEYEDVGDVFYNVQKYAQDFLSKAQSVAFSDDEVRNMLAS